MFDKQSAELEFRTRSDTAIETQAPDLSFQLLLNFYETTRATGAYPMSSDGDMLLFEFGTYDWGKGEEFSLTLTRQIIYPDEECHIDYPEQEIWQLSLTYFYKPGDSLRNLESGLFWCPNLTELPETRTKILTSPALLQCKQLAAISVNLNWKQQ